MRSERLRWIQIDLAERDLTLSQAIAQVKQAYKQKSWDAAGIVAEDDRVLWTIDEDGLMIMYFHAPDVVGTFA